MSKTKTQQYDYLLDYVNEAAKAREPLRQVINRVTDAYKMHPSHNSYRENANAYYQNIANSDPETARCVRALCDSIPESRNDTVFNAVETFVSMAMGGASQFEYEPADEYQEKDAALVDRLSELAKYFHDENKIDSLVPKATRKLIMQGQANFYLNPTAEPGRFRVSLIDAYKMLHDPRASRSNSPRYTGFTEVRSWDAVKKNIKSSGNGYRLEVMNDVDQYISALQGTGAVSSWQNELRADLDTFNGIYKGCNILASLSKDKDGNTVSPVEVGYKGDDIEVAYIWDLVADIYAVIVNRRFIVEIKEHPIHRSVSVEYSDSENAPHTRNTNVVVDSPIVTIPFIEADWETFPVSPLFYCLDDFDTICSIESVLNHNLSVMAPITFQSASYDAAQMEKLSQVAGQIVEGTLNTFGVLNKAHDNSPCISAIERLEQRIKRMLGATDQFDLQGMIGGRATASEVSTINSAISQRMNAPLANMEVGMSELVQKMFAMSIIFSNGDYISFPFHGSVGTAKTEDLLGRSLIRAKLKSRIKLEEEQQGRNALMVLQNLVGAEGINKENLITTLVPIITQGVVSRRQAESFIAPQGVDPIQILQAQQQVDQMQQQSAQDMGMPITPDMVQGMSPEDFSAMSQAIAGATQPQTQPQAQPTVDTGYDNYQAGVESNPAAIENMENIL